MGGTERDVTIPRGKGGLEFRPQNSPIATLMSGFTPNAAQLNTVNKLSRKLSLEFLFKVMSSLTGSLDVLAGM